MAIGSSIYLNIEFSHQYEHIGLVYQQYMHHETKYETILTDCIKIKNKYRKWIVIGDSIIGGDNDVVLACLAKIDTLQVYVEQQQVY